jgi:hypothetical protein
MKIGIKDLAVSMEVKNKGVEFEVHDNDGQFLGDLVVSKARLVWCPGKTGVDNGHRINWTDFIEFMKTRPKG